MITIQQLNKQIHDFIKEHGKHDMTLKTYQNGNCERTWDFTDGAYFKTITRQQVFTNSVTVHGTTFDIKQLSNTIEYYSSEDTTHRYTNDLYRG